MAVPADWIEHRRGDNELIGWMVPEGEDFATIDLLGRRSTAVDWLTAEERLEELGIGYLADRFAYWKTPSSWTRVKLIEVSPTASSCKRMTTATPSAVFRCQHTGLPGRFHASSCRFPASPASPRGAV